MNLTNTIFISLLIGFLPALIWLYYWLQEDKKHPEPGFRIFNTFVYGMLAVPFALAFQVLVNIFILENKSIESVFASDIMTAIMALFIWASLEEIFKYVAAYRAGISKKDNDEPIDPVVYMITAALGFSALENTLFVFSPLLQADTTTAFITGNFRFIGATLLHVASSAIIGMFMAFSYYKRDFLKIRYLFSGFILSIALHTAFNSFIISSENFKLISFISVWIIIVGIIILLEKVKRIYKHKKQ